MKPTDVKIATHIDLGFEFNTKKTELGAGGHVGISKYKFIFLKGYKPNWTEVFLIKKVKNIHHH